MPVVVVDSGQGLVKIGSQTVQTKQIGEKAAAGQPNLAIRPEELRLGHMDGANNLLGKVDAITYRAQL